MTDHAKVIGNRLRKCRTERNWTLEEACRQLTRVSPEAINVSRLNMWELGLRQPKIELFHTLGKVYQRPAAYLAGLDDYEGAGHYVFPQQHPGITGLTEPLIGDDSVGFHVNYLAELGISDRDSLVLFRMPDDSMRGVISRDDRALIDLAQLDVRHKGLFALVVNGRVWIRWIRPEVDGQFTITAADAEQHPDKRVDLEGLAAFRIIGRVVSIINSR